LITVAKVRIIITAAMHPILYFIVLLCLP
jgi:hypothetical protein